MKPTKIAHVSDLHWFLIKGHDHLEKAKEELINILKKEKIELTVLAGDIVDSKNHLSPEQIKAVREFLISLAEITPIILIPGNHDLDLSSPGREDSLSDSVEIINELVKPKFKIDYLKDSKIYDLYDINWAHWSVIENQKSPFKENEILKNDLTIGLFHGPVGTITLENSMQKVTDVNLDIFDKCNIVMLGDIHLRQSFRNEEIYYPGSWVELSFGEAEIWKNHYKVKTSTKGFVIWEYNGKSYTPRFQPIETEEGYKIIQVENFDTFKMPTNFIGDKKKVRLDYIGDKKSFSKQKINEIRKEIQIQTSQKVIFKFDPLEVENNIYNKKFLGPINHKEIFYEYFQMQLDEKGNKRFNKEEIDLFKEIDDEINNLIDLNNNFSQGQYQIDELNIHNFISFGPGNKIDFKNKKGLIGIFGNNRIGKSSIFEAISFCLFDEVIRDAENAKSLINDQNNDEDSFAFVEMKLWVNGVKYRIKRTISSKGSIKLEFYETLLDGKEKPRNAETKILTDKEIRKVIGNKKIFLILALSSQRNPYDFVDNGNKDRLEILKQILGVLIYNQKESKIEEIKKSKILELENLKNELKKIENIELLELKNIDNYKSIHQAILDLETINEKIKNNNEIIDLLNLDKETKQKNIVIKTRPESSIKFDLEFEKGILLNLEEEQKTISEFKEKNNLKIDDLKTQNIDFVNYSSRQEELYSLKSQIAEIGVSIKNEEEKLKQENIICEHCEKIISEVDKEGIKNQINILDLSKRDLEKKFKEISLIETSVNQLQKDILKYEKDELNNLSEIKNVNRKIEELNKELIDNKNNLVYEIEILEIEKKIKEKKSIINVLNSEEIESTLKINNLENEIKKNSEIIKKNSELIESIQKLEIEINYIKEYSKSVQRTGIPSLILSTYIPLINYEVNNYLNNIFDLKVHFEMTEGELGVYFYPRNSDISNKRNISMASGSEEFIINQVIRITLNKISFFVKPDFILIDEGFGTLDSNNIENIKTLLLKMENDFEKVLIISHEEALKSLPKNQINLFQENGVTYISNI